MRVAALRSARGIASILLSSWAAAACAPSYVSDTAASVDDGGLGGAISGDSAGGDAADACAVLYVSSEGSDTRDGCSPTRALRTIGGALALASSLSDVTGGVAPEIHACRGVFEEGPLVISRSARLRGGYNCTTWTRDSTFGSLTTTDLNETKIVMRVGAPNEATLTVAFTPNAAASSPNDAGADADADATTTSAADAASAADHGALEFEGFTVEGPSNTGAARSWALRTNGGRVVLNALHLSAGAVSGASPNPTPASVGLYTTATSVLLTNSIVEGGAGVNTDPSGIGSVAVLSLDGDAEIATSLLRSGTGFGPLIPSQGVFMQHASSVIVRDSEIAMQAGATPSTTNQSVSVGLNVTGGPTPYGTALFRGNRIHQDGSLPKGSAATPIGVFGLVTGQLDQLSIVGNRIDSGEVDSPTGTSYLAGVQVSNVSGTTLIAQNAIVVPGYGGHYANVGIRAGLRVYTQRTSILANTFVVPPPLLQATTVTEIAAIDLASSGTPSTAADATVRGNLSIGYGTNSVFDVWVQRCLGTPAQAVVADNFDVGTITDFAATVPGNCNARPPQTWMAAGFPNNESSVTDTGDPHALITPLIEGWSSDLTLDQVRAAVMSGTLRLKTSVQCKYAKRLTTFDPSITTDLAGVPRTSLYSIGAWEQDTCVP